MMHQFFLILGLGAAGAADHVCQSDRKHVCWSVSSGGVCQRILRKTFVSLRGVAQGRRGAIRWYVPVPIVQ